MTEGKELYAGLFEDEEEAWKAAQKAVADGYVAKRPTARDAAAKAAGLPRSKHVGVTWHKVDKKNSNHCLAHRKAP